MSTPNGHTQPPADRGATLARTLACHRWAAHLAGVARHQERACRRAIERAITAIEKSERRRFDPQARDLLAAALMVELTAYTHLGAHAAALTADDLCGTIPDVAAALAARMEASHG